MKIVKKILRVFVLLVVALLIIPFFTPKDYSVKKEININKPVNEVFQFVSHLKNMDKYSSWAEMDPNMKQEFEGTDGAVGFLSRWESDNKDIGIGEQEITKITPNKRMDFDLRFFEPFEANDKGYFETTSLSASETKVTWGFSGHMDYPMNFMMLFMDFEEMIGNDFEKSLHKLKNYMEK